MTKVKMQGPDNSSGFSHDGVIYEADDKDIIEVPSHIVEHAKPHGFSLITEKGPRKLEPLTKSAKGGADDSSGDGSAKLADDGEVKKSEKGAKSAKGGAE
jgi:hypothetical protein